MKPFDWIIPNVAQGSYPDPPASAFKYADTLVLCAEEKQAKGLRAPPGKRVLRVPYDDDPYTPLPVEFTPIFHAVAADLAKEVLRGRKVLITCAMGLNRSGLITALTMMHAYRVLPQDAIKLIRGRRHKDCLSNPMFVQWLLNQRVR